MRAGSLHSGCRQTSGSWPWVLAWDWSSRWSRVPRTTCTMEMTVVAKMTPRPKGCQKSTPAVIWVCTAPMPGTQWGMNP